MVLFPLPIILALALNELRSRLFKRFSQTLTYAPHFVSTVVVVGMLFAFLDPNTGLVNHALGLMGLDPIQFMQEPGWFRHLYVWSGVWQSLGWGTIIYLAALAGVNPELHQAAQVDGANRLQRIRHVNLPAIMPTVVILFILDFGSFMSVGFEKVLLMRNDLNASTADVIQTFVYETGLLQGQYSYAAAVGLFDSVINILLLITVNQLARKFSENSLWGSHDIDDDTPRPGGPPAPARRHPGDPQGGGQRRRPVVRSSQRALRGAGGAGDRVPAVVRDHRLDQRPPGRPDRPGVAVAGRDHPRRVPAGVRPFGDLDRLPQLGGLHAGGCRGAPGPGAAVRLRPLPSPHA